MQTRIEILKEINREIKRTVDVFFFYFLFHSLYLLNDMQQNQISVNYHGSQWLNLEFYFRVRLIMTQKFYFINMQSKGGIDN